MEEITAGKISEAIRFRIARPGSFTMTNTFVKNSPWEADVLRVLKSGYWHEYEIKLSVSDYRADFRKKVTSWKKESARKHDLYKSPDVLRFDSVYGGGWRHKKLLIPKPATYHFVTPAGLLDGITLPDHVGLIEVAERDRGAGLDCKTVKRAPRLKSPTKLSWQQLFNLCLKK